MSIPLDYNALEFWLKFSAVLAQGVTFCWLFLINKNKVTNSRINEMEEATSNKLQAMALRLERLEADARHAPTHDDLKRVHARMDESMGEVRQLGGKLDAMAHTLRLIEEHLLNRDR